MPSGSAWPSPGGLTWSLSRSSPSQSPVWDQPSSSGMLVVLPDLDLHVRPPVEPGMSAAQLKVNLPGDQATQRDDALGGRCTSQAAWAAIAATQPTVSWPGHCDRPVPDMPTSRQRTPSVSRRRMPPLRLRSPFKSARAHHLRVQCFHDPQAGLQRDKLPINVRLICYLLQRGMWIILAFSAST